MCVIMFVGSLCYFFCFSVLLEYVREMFIVVDIEVCYWYLQNFVLEDFLYVCFDNLVLQMFNEQLVGVDGLIIVMLVYKVLFFGVLKMLFDLLFE